jgi:cellobiose PTS system EIIC component
MDGFLAWVENRLMPPLIKVSEQRHVRAIRNGIVSTIPFIIAGSLFLIIAFPPVESWSNALEPFRSKLLVPVDLSFGMIALYAAFSIGSALATEYKLDAHTGGLLATFTFLLTNIPADGALKLDGMGGQGLFLSILAAIFAVEVYRFFVTKKLVIRLPEGVPPAVGRSFVALLPAMFLMVTMWGVRVILNVDLFTVIVAIFKPLVWGLNTLPGILLYLLLMTLLWTVGVHGDAVLSGVGAPVFLTMLEANVRAAQAGTALPYITSDGFNALFVNLGGTGATLGLAILMLRSRSKAMKDLGRVAVIPGVFNINEPIVFGLPVVFNPIMAIPYIVSALTCAAISYVAMWTGLVGRIHAAVPWTMPIGIGNYLMTGDWKAGVLAILLLFLTMAIYYPFFKIMEKRYLAVEQPEDEKPLAKAAH